MYGVQQKKHELNYKLLVEIYENIHQNVFRLTCHWQKNKNILLRTQNYFLFVATSPCKETSLERGELFWSRRA